MKDHTVNAALYEYFPTPIELANELCLLYDCRCILVEGETDKFFWSHVPDLNIYVACKKGCSGNKEYVIKVIDEINKRKRANAKISGIIDLDFDYIENNILSIDNLFYYQYHDFEIMLIKSKAFDIVNSRISSKAKKIETNKLRNLLFESTYPLGLVRLINCQNNMGIDFDKVKIEKLFDFKNDMPDENSFLQYIVSLLKLNKASAEIFNKKYSELKDKCYPKEYVCNGHDVINLLSLLTNKVISNDNPIKYVEEVITCFLSAEYFVQFMNDKEDCLSYCELLKAEILV